MSRFTARSGFDYSLRNTRTQKLCVKRCADRSISGDADDLHLQVLEVLSF